MDKKMDIEYIHIVGAREKRLLEKNYIFQQRRETDRRIYNITLTQSGKDFLERTEKFRNTIMNLINDTLSEEEVECFVKLCKKITDSYVDE